MWVNFNSPLLWDVFAISTYLTVSVIFWYLGLIPDFAMLRDRINKNVKPFTQKMRCGRHRGHSDHDGQFWKNLDYDYPKYYGIQIRCRLRDVR